MVDKIKEVGDDLLCEYSGKVITLTRWQEAIEQQQKKIVAENGIRDPEMAVTKLICPTTALWYQLIHRAVL